jgi:pilus assembly protein Flp/PilA
MPRSYHRANRKGRKGIMELFNRIVREEEGQDLIEYALIAGFISVICYLIIQATGTSVSLIWDKVNTAAGAAAGA